MSGLPGISMVPFQTGFDFNDAPRYPDTPGYSNPTTSKAAADGMKPTAPALRTRIVSELQVRADFGATCDELEQAFDLPHQTVSARIRELALGEKIVDSGNKRPTRSGRAAIVWHAKEGWR
jgi:hypothetical protein